MGHRVMIDGVRGVGGKKGSFAGFGLLFLVLIFSGIGWAETDCDFFCKADMVLIKKSERKLYLMNNGQIYRDYRIALGGNPSGSKQRQGDDRTPEGEYVLDWRTRDSKYYKSIHISYPNAKDLRTARSKGVAAGGDIMIHGTPAQDEYPDWLFEVIDWTDGCIAVANDAMDVIWASVDVGTPVTIVP
jgi:murein L,D-transpeptidase YafK